MNLESIKDLGTKVIIIAVALQISLTITTNLLDLIIK